MSDTGDCSYTTHMDVKCDALGKIDVPATDQWYNQTLSKVNSSVVRLGIMQGEYHWHKHDGEFFFVFIRTICSGIRRLALRPRSTAGCNCS